jgi:hypothetical protein
VILGRERMLEGVSRHVPLLYAASFGGSDSRPTAVPDDLLDSGGFKQAVQRRYGRIEALCGQIDGPANGTALDVRTGRAGLVAALLTTVLSVVRKARGDTS